ncbi:hypothetical protein NVV95_13890 [Herbiconiux sp. CPCC 205716]|uniref:Chemotaxis protein n=1 Tax=Herbiconiux gentiana TaxID=2970912 RepID=A0ABT2GL40_9MICO|nr:hypothetical protein [Herbiconiux gentiana]MCS5715639.1 hypothetical protein [Herbiconiux gentiana]
MTDTAPTPDDADHPDALDQAGSFGAPAVDAAPDDSRDPADQPDGVDERGEKSSLDPDHESFAAREAHVDGAGPNGSGTSSPDGIGAYSDGPDASAEPADPHADSPNPDADGVA